MLYIVIGYAASYLLSMILPVAAAIQYLSIIAFSPSDILHGQVWRLLTWVIYPSGSILTVVLTLYFSYVVGTSLERDWGAGKFTIFYLLGILFHIVYGFLVWLITGLPIPLISNYLSLSLLLTFATVYPNQIILLFFVLPVKAKWIGLIAAGYNLIMVAVGLIRGEYIAAFLPIVAALNYLLFFTGVLISAARPYKVRNSKQAINFRKAARRKRNEERSRPYRHKCAVCGKTDAEYPNLEFRYCSRCNGYHCFCIDHINSHIHFQ
jgi:membrane associated rhomboid family serine protease